MPVVLRFYFQQRMVAAELLVQRVLFTRLTFPCKRTCIASRKGCYNWVSFACLSGDDAEVGSQYQLIYDTDFYLKAVAYFI